MTAIDIPVYTEPPNTVVIQTIITVIKLITRKEKNFMFSPRSSEGASIQKDKHHKSYKTHRYTHNDHNPYVFPPTHLNVSLTAQCRIEITPTKNATSNAMNTIPNINARGH
jgi:hypothetical protein